MKGSRVAKITGNEKVFLARLTIGTAASINPMERKIR